MNSRHSSLFVSSKGSYRADIDGLRAVSVLSVLFYHAFPESLSGGFTGVDVFFVISGYLITGLLLKEIEKKEYSYAHFIARRARRIVPALSLVMLSVWLIGWFDLFAEEFISLSQQLLYGSLFSANVLFYKQVGYFDRSGDLKPFLHLWSLGIEEQFYLVWPFILYYASRFKIHFVKLCALVIFLSLTLELIVYPNHHVAAFFLIPFRFWEIAAGSLLACMESKQYFFQKLSIIHRNLLSVIGLAAILWGVFWIKRESFPGPWPLVPVLGAFFFLAAGRAALCNRFLSLKPFVWVGLISYPLYLWHWPLLSLDFILKGSEPSVIHRSFALILSFILATLTYLFLEKRTRHTSIKTALWVYPSLLVFIAALGLAGIRKEGFPSRLAAVSSKQGELDHVTYHHYVEGRNFPCEPDYLRNKAPQWNGVTRCHQSKQKVAQTVAVVGDSHAEALFPGLAASLPNENVVYFIQGARINHTREFKDIFAYIAENKNIHSVFINGYWTQRLPEKPVEEYKEEIEQLLAYLIKSGKKVYIANDVPDLILNPGRCKAVRMFSPYHPICIQPLNAEWINKQEAVNKILKEAAEKTGASFVDTAQYFQKEGQLFMADETRLFYRDNDHLGINGSLYIGENLIRSGIFQR